MSDCCSLGALCILVQLHFAGALVKINNYTFQSLDKLTGRQPSSYCGATPAAYILLCNNHDCSPTVAYTTGYLIEADLE